MCAKPASSFSSIRTSSPTFSRIHFAVISPKSVSSGRLLFFGLDAEKPYIRARCSRPPRAAALDISGLGDARPDPSLHGLGHELRPIAKLLRERFNARLRDELLDGEIFYSLREAQMVIGSSWRHYDHIKPHVALGYKPPAPEVFAPAIAARPAAPRQTAPPATLAPKPALN